MYLCICCQYIFNSFIKCGLHRGPYVNRCILINMTTRTHLLVNDEYYHVYNRGNSKQIIFIDEQDYKVFQQFLYLMNMEQRITSREVGDASYSYVRDKELVHIGAYCIMPNHFHILLTQKEDNGVSKFMLKLSTAYAMYFNQKYKRTGSLYEGAFKSKHVNDDTYLKYLYSYIHLNPLKLVNSKWKDDIKLGKSIKSNDLKYVTEYQYSSIGYYLKKDLIENMILNLSDFPNYFPTNERFLKEIISWIRLKDYLK